MNYQIQNKVESEKAVLVGVELKSGDAHSEEYLDELEFLATTAGAETIKRFTQRLDHPNPKTYVGKGKVEEIAVYAHLHKIDLVIFDDELSPSQIRNLEKELECKIVDRSSLILGHLRQECPNRSSQDPGGIGPKRIPPSSTDPHVDPLEQAKRRHRDERTGRKGDRD